MSVTPFPQAVRDRREHLLRVAASAAALLEAAVASGNATMIERVFEALGAFAQNDDAIDRLDSFAVRDAQVVAITAAQAERAPRVRSPRPPRPGSASRR